MTKTAQLEKRTKIEEAHPPREIRENTKARRAWLAAKLKEVNATPERAGKIVGAGSYQCVSVYKIETTEARIQLRGVCQGCGGSVAIENGVTSKHGYKRPGDGSTYGRCAGQRYAPANVSLERATEIVAGVRQFAASCDKTAALEEERAASLKIESDALFAREAYRTDERAAWLEAHGRTTEAEGKARKLRYMADENRRFADFLETTTTEAHGTPLAEIPVA